MLVDTELFVGARKIQLALANKSCSEALQWCNDNKTNLKRIKVPYDIH